MFCSYIQKKNEIKNAEKSLIPNVFAFFASERSFSTTKHLKLGWDQQWQTDVLIHRVC